MPKGTSILDGAAARGIAALGPVEALPSIQLFRLNARMQEQQETARQLAARQRLQQVLAAREAKSAPTTNRRPPLPGSKAAVAKAKHAAVAPNDEPAAAAP